MDFADVFKEVADFFIVLCNVKCTFAGIEFTVGSVFVWCILAAIFIGALKGGAE